MVLPVMILIVFESWALYIQWISYDSPLVLGEKKLLLFVLGPKPRHRLPRDKVAKAGDALGSLSLVFYHCRLARCEMEIPVMWRSHAVGSVRGQEENHGLGALSPASPTSAHTFRYLMQNTHFFKPWPIWEMPSSSRCKAEIYSTNWSLCPLFVKSLPLLAK